MGFRFLAYHNVFHVIILLVFMARLNRVSVQKMRGNETDRLALLDIKGQITDDPFEITSSWNDSLHFCFWKGVTCGRKHQRVVELDLESNRLRGQISPSIANLSFLRGVYLHNNSFRGEIPLGIGRLNRLIVLNLGSNSLSGKIPSNLSSCSNLSIVFLDSNNLTGEIPSELGAMPSLVQFNFYFNKLQGKIPPQLGNISSLREIDITMNQLEGRIPESLGLLPYLTGIQLSDNNISGTIPQSIYNHSTLASLMLSDNRLEGELPLEIGLTLPRLTRFVLAGNRFIGRIPISFANSSYLTMLELSLNGFSGGVPSIFGNLKRLEDLRLDDTNLGSGNANDLDFITSLTNCTDLQGLGLVNSNFGGTFPVSIFNLSTKLYNLGMGKNQISGNIPCGIKNLKSLNIFTIGNNRLNGTIPGDIGTLENLRVLGLHNNRFSGEIPSSLGNLTSLLKLSIEKNNLQGRIPSSLGKCTNLDMLDLSSNSLNGPIPQVVVELPSLTIFLDLSRNNLSGSLPSEVSKLKNLDWLDISFNQLSGVVPPSLGECTMLRILNMRHNRFVGTIPESLSLLQSIEVIDLSHNNLSGQIPSKMVELTFLSTLNLSSNDLEGELPTGGVFSNASAISISGNGKLCGGIRQLRLKACPKKKLRKRSSFRGGKLIISMISGILVVSLVLYLIFSWWFKKKRKQQVQTSSVNPFARVSYGELLKATDGFSSENLIGEGGIGSVYKGIMESDQTVVAVKVFNLEKIGASKSFASECETLRAIRHRNLVKIITVCSSIDYQGNELKAIVYELMPNGNLDSLLHPISPPQTVDQSPLTMSKRIDIAIDVASAVDYLHNNVETPIVHCDLKPSNILLDQENTAHVGDFGLSRIIQHDNAEISNIPTNSSGLKGTIGYAAPEYGMGSKASKEGDVYSFGILLLEMFTGKRPTDSYFGEGMNLNQFVKTALPEKVTEIVDQGLIVVVEDNESTSNDAQEQTRQMKIRECCATVLKIGVMCSDEFPRARMKIDEALKELYAAKKMLL